MENRITFRIKAGCYLKLARPEMMKLLGNTKTELAKDENGLKCTSFRKIFKSSSFTEIGLIHFNMVNNYYQEDSRVLHAFARITDQNTKPLELKEKNEL